jgi:hypothetical protein
VDFDHFSARLDWDGFKEFISPDSKPCGDLKGLVANNVQKFGSYLRTVYWVKSPFSLALFFKGGGNFWRKAQQVLPVLPNPHTPWSHWL